MLHSALSCSVPSPGHTGYCWINLILQIAISKCSMLGNLHILSFLLWSESCGIQMSAVTKFEYIKVFFFVFLLHTWERMPDAMVTCSHTSRQHMSLRKSAMFLFSDQIKKTHLSKPHQTDERNVGLFWWVKEWMFFFCIIFFCLSVFGKSCHGDEKLSCVVGIIQLSVEQRDDRRQMLAHTVGSESFQTSLRCFYKKSG